MESSDPNSQGGERATPEGAPPSQPAIIDLFADTGHHFVFVPLAMPPTPREPGPGAHLPQQRVPVVRCTGHQRPALALAPLPIRSARAGRHGPGRMRRAPGNRHQSRPRPARLGPPARGSRSPPTRPRNTRRRTGSPRLTFFQTPRANRLVECIGSPSICPSFPRRPRDSSALARSLSLDLEIHWLEPVGKMVDVDLIVDFGNTRLGGTAPGAEPIRPRHPVGDHPTRALRLSPGGAATAAPRKTGTRSP